MCRGISKWSQAEGKGQSPTPPPGSQYAPTPKFVVLSPVPLSILREQLISRPPCEDVFGAEGKAEQGDREKDPHAGSRACACA